MAIRKDAKRGTYSVDYYLKDPVTHKLHKTCKRGFVSRKDAKLYEATVSKIYQSSKTLEGMFLEYQSTSDGNADTRQRDKARFDKYVSIKHMPVNKIKKSDLISWSLGLKNCGLANSSINSIYGYVKSTFKYAFNVYDIPNISDCITKLKTSRTEKEILTPDEFAHVISFEDNPIYKAFFYTAYWTGCRRGELKALQKSDYKNGSLYVRNSMRLGPESMHEGTKASRDVKIVKLDNDTINVITPLLKGKGYLFGDDVPLTNESIRRHLRICMKLSGIEKHISFHSLRHSHGSVLLAYGLDLASVSKRLGHSNITTTANIYSHVLDKSGQRSVDLIEKIKHKA